MAKIIIIKNKNTTKKAVWQKSMKRGSIRIGLVWSGFLTVAFMIFCSAFYLFQVNDLAMKGYEIRDLENKIADLEKDNKKMQIREMELDSMYNIEKTASDFNLVSLANVSYLELDGPVALK